MNVATDIRWLLLAASVPGREAGTQRVRLWRTLKEHGAAMLRDGVSVLPATEEHDQVLRTLAAEVTEAGGTAFVLELPQQRDPMEDALLARFDRTEDYAALVERMGELRRRLQGLDEAEARRGLRQLGRDLEGLAALDFFSGDVRQEATDALAMLEAAINQQYSPNEPSAAPGSIAARDPGEYTARLWATRRRLWVDRIASAWLIRRFIDPDARFLWLEQPQDCPEPALGFDFDGAAFTHIGERVTFEVLLAAFGLEDDPGLRRLGALVHYLDVGGEPVPEASGFESVLAGMRRRCEDDDTLLDAMTPVLEAFYESFNAVPNRKRERKEVE